ncbi:MAG: GTP-binding protein [bacterium]|nr:GTP-binding protein [bacterium]
MSDLSPLQGLTNLTKLDARKNSITSLPEALLQLDLEIDVDTKDLWEGSGILLYGNPLKSPPPEIIRIGKDAIRNYFRSLETGLIRPLNEVKVILVGDGGAGKTSLVNHILYQTFNPQQNATEGIAIKHWYPQNTTFNEDIQVRIWDFGGQEILHATHQFFLSKRSLYILVLDGRKDEKTEYWLKQIQSFGKNSPVFVVLNKIDQHPRFDVNRKFLQNKYPNIIGFHRISCMDNSGIDDFIETLTNNLDKVELLGSTWSVKWFKVKERLEAMKDHYIDYHRYRQFCKAEGIDDEKTRATLVEFLNDLGVVLHFSDRNLAHTHVLDPEWVTNAVYKIINSKDNGAVDGVLPLSQLDLILADCKENSYCYPKETHGFLIGLMEKFELCYQMDPHRILIPDLLEEGEKLSALEGQELLTFIFKYQFFPRSIMPRFIVRLHKDIKNTLRWRTGVVLENADYPNTTALVKADEKDGKITVWVSGDMKRDYFQVIRATLNGIHRTFDKLEVEQLIPLPGADHHMVDYEELMGYERAGRQEYFSGKLDRSFDVGQLLNGVVSREKRMAHYKQHNLESLRVPKGNGDTIINLQNINQQKQQTNVDLDIEVNVNVEMNLSVELPDLQSHFDDLRDILSGGFPDLEGRLEQVDKELYGVDENSKPKQLKRPLTKLGNFLRKLGEGSEKYKNLLEKGGKALDNAQAMARTYNKFSQWIPGLPVIPDVLLGKKE